MKIKTRLSFQFTLIVAGLLLMFSALVYYFSYSTQRDRFRNNLTNEAKNNAILLLNVKEVDSTLLTKIQSSTFNWQKEEIAITNSNFHLIYGFNISYLTNQAIRLHISKNDVSYFEINEKDGSYYKHRYNNHEYNVLVMAYDNARRENLRDLRTILFWINLVSIGFVVFLSYIFSRNAIKPISKIIQSVKGINSYMLSKRLDEGNRKDEIAQLAITFNEMLINLETAFKNQDEFVSHASHELRTPLTVMISESDFVINHETETEEYKRHIIRMVEDLKRLNAQLNILLELAQINKEKVIQLTKVRIDEIIFTAISQIKYKYYRQKIIPKIQYPENENELLINGNSGMLAIAFINILDNACKFSDDDVIVEILIASQFIEVTVSDKGIGIPKEELDHIYRPFNRASNVKFISGFGIGLSLVAKIFKLHDVEIKIESAINEGTRFKSIFKRPEE